MKISVALKFALLLSAILVAVFLLEFSLLIQREVNSGRNQIITNSDTFSRLSTAEIIRNYNVYYDSGFIKYAEVMRKLFQLNPDLTKILIINQNGEILFDSEEINKGKYQAQEGQFRMIGNDELPRIRGLVPTSQLSMKNGVESYEVINPFIEEWGGHYYTVKYYFSFQSLQANLKTIIIGSAIVMASFCIGIIILIFLLSSFVIVRPLKKIAAAAEAFNKGSANYEVDIRSKDEIGDLAANLNRIFSDLKKTRLDMESYAKNLEEKITKRTKELELRNIRQSQANEKLENINKLMVGRELRMIELKKELEKERKLLNEKK